MSVHAGIWNFNEKPADRELLANISSHLREFGPDGETIHTDGPFGIVYRPFATTPEARVERQPLTSSKGLIVAWDGRLDNRDELLSQLSWAKNRTITDVAIVGMAFDKWGEQCFAKLIGDWSFCGWDARKHELILARDYIGIRQLFYYPQPERVLWCNHLASLALCGDRFTLSNQYVAGYLAGFPEAHLTPYREIHSVAPGHFIRITAKSIISHTYWTFVRSQIRHRTDAEYEEHYRALFRQAVQRRLRTDSPILAELSGGLDSSSIVCMADDINMREGGRYTIDTFSYYDSNEPGEDDFFHQSIVKQKRGGQGHRIDLKGSGDSIPLEYPTFSAIPGFGSRTEIRAGLQSVCRCGNYRVMLCGTGGDELNGQTLHPRVLLAELLTKGSLVELGKQLISWSLLMRQPLPQLFAETVVSLLPATLRSWMSDYGQLEPWIDRRFAAQQRMSVRQTVVLEKPWLIAPATRYASHTLVLMGRQMTYKSPGIIEARYPYLDQTLTDFLCSIPLSQLLRLGQQRSLMRRALIGFVPPEILARKTKAASMRCYPVALQKHWSRMEEVLHKPLIHGLGYVDKDAMYSALLSMRNGQMPRHFLRLFKAFFLELWLRDLAERQILSIHLPRFRDSFPNVSETQSATLEA